MAARLIRICSFLFLYRNMAISAAIPVAIVKISITRLLVAVSGVNVFTLSAPTMFPLKKESFNVRKAAAAANINQTVCMRWIMVVVLNLSGGAQPDEKRGHADFFSK